MSKYPSVTIYTDGSCEPNPGAGGWAALLLFPGRQIPLSGAEADTTNKRDTEGGYGVIDIYRERTEKLAAEFPVQDNYFAWQALARRYDTENGVALPEYLKKGITEWMPNWRARNWRRKGGKLANVDLWKALDQILTQHQVEWRWVKAHATSRYNNMVDQLAREAMKRGNEKN